MPRERAARPTVEIVRALKRFVAVGVSSALKDVSVKAVVQEEAPGTLGVVAVARERKGGRRGRDERVGIAHGNALAEGLA